MSTFFSETLPYLRGAGFFLIVFAFGSLGAPLGGFIYMLSGLSLRIPYLGRLSQFLLNGSVKTVGLVKVVSWCLSSAGLLYGYFLGKYFLGPPRSTIDYVAIAVPALVGVINTSYSILYFEMIDIEGYFSASVRFMPKHMRELLIEADDDDLIGIARRNFADMNFILLLKFLAASGLLIFSLAHLEVFGPAARELPLLTSLQYSLSPIGLGSSPTEELHGVTWSFLRFLIGLVLLVWLAVFIAFSMDSLPDAQRLRARLGRPPLPEQRSEPSVAVSSPPKSSSRGVAARLRTRRGRRKETDQTS